jgi:hypothetical protein
MDSSSWLSIYHFRIAHSLHCELHYKVYWHPTKSTILNIVYLILIWSYVFRRDCHLQGAHTNFVKTYSNKHFSAVCFNYTP